MAPPPPEIGYGTWREFAGWSAAPRVAALIRQFQARRVLEIGSGANPTLDSAAVEELGIDYTINDVSEEELGKSGAPGRRLIHDFGGSPPPVDLHSGYDLVFSRMVNEHVRDGSALFRNIRLVLRPGGVTAHWFSTLYALPFVVNRLLPEAVSRRLLRLIWPRDEHRHGKFRAWYSYCRGPTREMIRRFREAGFEVLAYRGYFGHGYYLKRIPLLQRLEDRKARFLVRHPLPLAGAYAEVVLRRPDRDGSAGITSRKTR